MFFEKFFPKKEPEKNKEEERKEKLKIMLKENIETRKKYELSQSNESMPTKLYGEWRPEYAEGEAKLNFHHTYSSGAVLNAEENPEGIVSINFTDKENKKVLEVEKSLPSSYYFVSPSYIINNHDLLEKYMSSLGVFQLLDENLILIGDMKSGKDLLSIFHEMGHINQKRGLISAHGYEEISKRERGAWAFALKKVREIKKETGVNIFESFNSKQEVLEFVYAHLYEYRSSIKRGLLISYFEEDGSVEYISNLLKQFFDKGRFPKITEKGERTQ